MKRSPKDLANITGIYNRDFRNWRYMCRKCHIEFDNIIERNFAPYREQNKKYLKYYKEKIKI